MKKVDLITRFWLLVDKRSDEECWNWLGNKRNGYGRFWVEDRLLSAHRVSWELAYGSIKEGIKVLHHCDNPSCVNPSHLFLGTQTDNMQDMTKKNRRKGPIGSECHNVRLDETKVKDIRIARLNGLEYTEIASLFGVSKGCINHILNGRSWTWLK